MDKKYYKVSFGTSRDLMDSYSVCIVGVRRPSKEEAKKFCKKDMEKWNYEFVIDVVELSAEEAYMFYDMECENEFPIFGIQ